MHQRFAERIAGLVVAMKAEHGLIPTQLWIDERFTFTPDDMNQVHAEIVHQRERRGE